jgi:phosphatidylinositol 3-kinase
MPTILGSKLITDSLKLLNTYKKKNNIEDKLLAIQKLSKISDDVLQIYLLQLVQALRHDFDFEENSRGFVNIGIGPLGKFLIKKAINNKIFASYFHWYIRVEIKLSDRTNSDSEFFQLVYKRFLKDLKTSKNGASIAKDLRLQGSFIKKMLDILYKVSSEKDSSEKTLKLKKLLSEIDFPENIPFPLDPTKNIISIDRSSAKIFPSSNSPAILKFGLLENGKQFPSTIMFKSEDLRQDQLCISMIRMIDNIFLEEKLDLHLTYYNIIATSSKDGFLEFVPNAMSLSKILRDHKRIDVFFRKNTDNFKALESCQDRFIKSAAGNTIITYLLGVGDRHLDNIMIKETGELFHVDFGFMFGRDPKPFKSEMRITKEMIVGMGGPKSSGFHKFRTYCWQAFKILRSNYFLIMNMLSLMVSSKIPDLSVLQNADTSFKKTKAKFKMNLTESEAEMFIYETIDNSSNALGPIIMEYLHQTFSSSKEK